MSTKNDTFKFSLRGKDSLASKWIEQKRSVKGTLKENGALKQFCCIFRR